MPDQQFESVDEIRKHFGKLIKDAEDADKGGFQLQQAEAIAAFADARATAAERKVWVKDALDKYPAAKEFPELVTGGTLEEIEASAKATADRIGKLTAASASNDEGARKLYGDAITPGGGTPAPPRASEDEKFIADFQQRWNGNDANGGENGGVSKQEINRYVQLISGTHIAAHLAENSRIPAVRAALAAVKPK